MCWFGLSLQRHRRISEQRRACLQTASRMSACGGGGIEGKGKGRVRHRLLHVLLLLACVVIACVTPAARAQSESLPRDVVDNVLLQPVVLSRRLPLQIDAIAWGWTGSALHADMHSPVRITLSSGPNAVSGLLSLVYPQDGSQNARVTVPFSTTPNVGVTVELQACPARGTAQMRLEIMADGRQFIKQLDSPISATLNDIAKPLVAASPLWLVLGPDLTLKLSNSDVGYAAADSNTGAVDYWDQVVTSTLAPTRFSQAWMAYESVDGIVARERDLRTLTSVQRDAIRTWLENGGRMVVSLDEAGEGWREWLPDFLPANLLDISEVQRVQPGLDVRSLLKAAENTARSEWAQTPASVAGAPYDIRARLITPSDTAHALGWRGFWESDISQPLAVPLTPDRTRLAASGPVGLGVLTLLGVDPANLPAFMNGTESARAWRDAMERTRDATHRDASRWQQWQWNQNETVALSRAADSIVAASPPGGLFFLVVMCVIFALALWVGPVGRIILKRRGLLSRNWAIALGAIALCTLVGLLAPRIFRQNTDNRGTLTLHDVFVDPEGKPVRVYTSRMHAVFAGAPDEFDLAGVDLRAQDPAGQWWRGVSPVANWWETRLKPGGGATIINTPASRASPAAGVLRPVEVAQWTLRLYMSMHPGTPTPRDFTLPRVQVSCSARDRASSTWRDDLIVRVTPGDSHDDDLGFAAIHYCGRIGRPQSVSREGDQNLITYSVKHSHTGPTATTDIDNYEVWLPGAGQPSRASELSFIRTLPLRSRTDTVNRITASGDYAAVLVTQTRASITNGTRTLNKIVYRVIAPVTINPDAPPAPPDETTLPEDLE